MTETEYGKYTTIIMAISKYYILCTTILVYFGSNRFLYMLIYYMIAMMSLSDKKI